MSLKSTLFKNKNENSTCVINYFSYKAVSNGFSGFRCQIIGNKLLIKEKASS